MAVTAFDPSVSGMPAAGHFESIRASWDRFRVWDSAHRPWSDAALAAVLLVGCLLFPRSFGGDHAVNTVLQFALVLPLAWRRRAPSAVFAVIAAVALVQWVVAVPLPADLALLVALFTLAVHDTPARALAGAGILEVGVLMASLRWRPVGDTALASVVFLSGMVAAALFVGLTLRTWRAYMDSLVERANRLELERDQRARLAAATERSRIAREMHDVVAHNVSSMVTLAEGARAATASDPLGAAEAMGEVSATGRLALADMRNLLGVLHTQGARTDRAPQPDLSALPTLIEGVRSTGLAVDLDARGVPFEVPPGVGLTLYRMAQESLTNVLKHGDHVSKAVVTLDFERPFIGLSVRDDGATGPVPGDGAVGPAAGGHGLRGMRERAAVCGGTLIAGPHPGGGWEVAARVRVDGARTG
jgi:signal transduction histidine kinase